jgi:hypothetical protein
MMAFNRDFRKGFGVVTFGLFTPQEPWYISCRSEYAVWGDLVEKLLNLRGLRISSVRVFGLAANNLGQFHAPDK